MPCPDVSLTPEHVKVAMLRGSVESSRLAALHAVSSYNALCLAQLPSFFVQ